MSKRNKVIMFASDFSKYGKVQAMKSTLEFLTTDAGHIFVFVNDPMRGDVPKVKIESEKLNTTVTGILLPKEINELLEQLEDKHAV